MASTDTKTNAWEVWSRDRYQHGRYKEDSYFVAAFKDKGAAKARMTRLRRSHPDTMYFLKHRKSAARMHFGSRQRTRSEKRRQDHY